MGLAFNWLPSCDVPVESIEKNENEQIIETMLAKMAKKHNIENYKKFVSYIGHDNYDDKFVVPV